MSRLKKTFLALSLLLVGVQLTVWLVHRPTRVTQQFVGHLSQERYSDAAGMLVAPSAIIPTPDGNLAVVDETGRSVEVLASQLPFSSGGGKADGPGEFSMTALGSSTNGLLDEPAVILYLSTNGGEIRIERVES